ncbi:MAG: hypothetical protein IKU18_05335, partial [Bacteroidales bacterium]|nr:hypothetical protein [Bacteroidales bacterium]
MLRAIYKIKGTLLLAFLLVVCCITASAQDKIRVQGKITDILTGEPISSANIIVNGYIVASSDVDGNYSCTVARDAQLIIYSREYEELKIKVDNRQIINIQMQMITFELEGAVITASYGSTKVFVEPSDLQLVGDHFVLKTTVRIPKKRFDLNSRFIFQPTLYNATLKDTSYFRPVVIDGENYHINQQRYFGFDSSKDLLADYVVTNNLSETENIYTYKDSIYVAPKNLEHDYMSVCFLGINGLFRREGQLFGGKPDYTDTTVIAKGTVNPLRFLEYNIDPQPITDTSLIPKPEMKLLMDAGTSKIQFVLDKAKVDETDAESVQNLNTIKEKLHAIVNNEFATLKSIDIVGYASPEGMFRRNTALAKARTEMILKELVSSLDPSVAKYVTLTSNSKVEPWSKVAQMLKTEDPELSAYIDDLVYRFSDSHDHIFPHMRNHKKYHSYLRKDILPALRKVEYTLNYSEFRKLKDHEIWERYRAKE